MYIMEKTSFLWCPYLLQEKMKKQANSLHHPANTSVDSHKSYLDFQHRAVQKETYYFILRLIPKYPRVYNTNKEENAHRYTLRGKIERKKMKGTIYTIQGEKKLNLLRHTKSKSQKSFFAFSAYSIL